MFEFSAIRSKWSTFRSYNENGSHERIEINCPESWIWLIVHTQHAKCGMNPLRKSWHSNTLDFSTSLTHTRVPFLSTNFVILYILGFPNTHSERIFCCFEWTHIMYTKVFFYIRKKFLFSVFLTMFSCFHEFYRCLWIFLHILFCFL